MKIFILCMLTSAYLFQIINMKKVRGIMSDEILEYELDKTVPSFRTYFSREHLILEQVGDDKYMAGGYFESIKSMDPNMVIRSNVRSQYYQNSKWNEGPVQLVQTDMCKDYTNPNRLWYNVTKLWTTCPPKKGDIWFIENQTLSAIVDVPTLPVVPWRAFIKVFQGIPGYEKHSYGFGIQLEFIHI